MPLLGNSPQIYYYTIWYTNANTNTLYMVEYWPACKRQQAFSARRPVFRAYGKCHPGRQLSRTFSIVFLVGWTIVHSLENPTCPWSRGESEEVIRPRPRQFCDLNATSVAELEKFGFRERASSSHLRTM
jgi:hypothetical protein